MAMHYLIVFEREDSGVYSAYVGGLPVYAHGATHAKTASAIVRTLRAYLDAHPQEQPRADVPGGKGVGLDPRPGPLEGESRHSCGACWAPHERAQAASSRANGRLGGCPRKVLAE